MNKESFRVFGYSLAGNKRAVFVDKSSIRGIPLVSIFVNSPTSRVKGLQTGITPDDARALAEALVAMAKEVEAIDTNAERDKYNRRIESKRRAEIRRSSEYRKQEIREAANRLARLEGRPLPYPNAND